MRLFLVRGSHMDSKPFKQHLYLKAQLRQEQLQFVRNELSLASTFLDVAEASRQRERRVRNIQNARKACDEVTQQVVQGLGCTDKERAEVADRLAYLKARMMKLRAGLGC